MASNFDFYRNTYLKTRQQQFRESAEFVKTDIQLQLMLAQVYQKEIASLEDLLYKAGKDEKRKKLMLKHCQVVNQDLNLKLVSLNHNTRCLNYNDKQTKIG